MDAQELIAAWEAKGEHRRIGGREVFVVDVEAGGEELGPPLLVLHGFPTSSIDFAAVLPALAAGRRVVLFDMLGYGLSEKPDQPYSLFEQANLVDAVADAAGLTAVDLLTHDMGDSVGGEVLARSLDGTLGFEVRRRVITNGSVFIGMAQLTDGQQLLLSLPDEKMPDNLGFDAAGVTEALRGTLAPGATVDEAHLRAAAELVCRDEGVEVLPRLIRYVEERRRHEDRWTGAIAAHPSPLTIVWGDADPVAVYPMAERLAGRRAEEGRDASDGFVRLEGVGHYPMIEVSDAFAGAVLAGLG